MVFLPGADNSVRPKSKKTKNGPGGESASTGLSNRRNGAVPRIAAARRRPSATTQKASAGIAISEAAPALIWWLSDVVCGITRAM